MKSIEINIPEKTITLETKRPPEKMGCDDFIWCIAAVFSFNGSSLSVEGSLFGFVKKLLEALGSALDSGRKVFLNDENGSYQITLSCKEGVLKMDDSFGNGCVSLPLDQFIKDLNLEFSRAIEHLEREIPAFLDNLEYRKIKTEIERMLSSLVINCRRGRSNSV